MVETHTVALAQADMLDMSLKPWYSALGKSMAFLEEGGRSDMVVGREILGVSSLDEDVPRAGVVAPSSNVSCSSAM